MMAPNLSVIFPTRNRAKLLEKALRSLEEQTLPVDQFDVVVVDNGSTDNTRAVVDGFHAVLPRLRYEYVLSPGLHVGRHRGMAVATTGILVFADDDICALPTWLEGMLEAFEDPMVGLAGGKCLPDFEVSPPPWVSSLWQDTPWGKALPAYSVLDFGDKAKIVPGNYIWGCNFGVRRSLLFEVGGFHPDGMPRHLLLYRGDGETAVARAVEALGFYALYHPKASVRHFVSIERMSRTYLYQRGFAEGVTGSYSAIRAGADRGGLMQLRLLGRLLKTEAAALLARLTADEAVITRKAFSRGYTRGFMAHQHAVAREPKLLEWIKKPNYLDALDD